MVKKGISKVSQAFRLDEFKKFAMKGNVMDMAVGVIIGAAFGKIVTSLVNDIIMGPLGILTGQSSLKGRFVALNGQDFESLEAAKKAGAPIIVYGDFIQNILDFLLVAFVLFLVVRQLNRLKNEQPGPPPEPTTKDCPQCLSKIPLNAMRCAHCTQPL